MWSTSIKCVLASFIARGVLFHSHFILAHFNFLSLSLRKRLDRIKLKEEEEGFRWSSHNRLCHSRRHHHHHHAGTCTHTHSSPWRPEDINTSIKRNRPTGETRKHPSAHSTLMDWEGRRGRVSSRIDPRDGLIRKGNKYKQKTNGDNVG